MTNDGSCCCSPFAFLIVRQRLRGWYGAAGWHGKEGRNLREHSTLIADLQGTDREDALHSDCVAN